MSAWWYGMPRCSAQYFGETFTGMPGGQRAVDHGLVDALGVQVDLDLAAAALHAIENRLPEIVAAFGDAALAVNAQAPPRKSRGRPAATRGQRVAAIGRVVLRRSALRWCSWACGLFASW